MTFLERIWCSGIQGSRRFRAAGLSFMARFDSGEEVVLQAATPVSEPLPKGTSDWCTCARGVVFADVGNVPLWQIFGPKDSSQGHHKLGQHFYPLGF